MASEASLKAALNTTASKDEAALAHSVESANVEKQALLKSFERKLTMALQEQRKSAEFQYMAQKQTDVTALVETEQKMQEAIAHYDQVAFDLNTEKSRYAELALQL